MMLLEYWVFEVEVGDGESLGHFLGRFRRANILSCKTLAEHLGVRFEWVRAWEVPSLRRNPTDLQLIALSKLVRVSPQRLSEMLPPEDLHLATRLCPACYREVGVHKTSWQRAGVDICSRHQLPLLSACPACGTCFQIPVFWDDPRCEYCGLAFEEMNVG